MPLRFLRWFCRPELLKYIEGDLIELYEENTQTKGQHRANWLFAWEVIKLFRPGIVGFNQSITQITHWTMFKNYLKVGMRNILKYKTFSFINVFGLAVAMSVAMLIILMIAEQAEMDQFNPNADRVVRVVTQTPNGGNANASTPGPIAEELRNYATVERVTQLVKSLGGDVITESKSVEVRGFFADEHFFDVMGFKLTQGAEATALLEPRSMVISQATAEKLFPLADPIGQSIQFSERGLEGIQIDLGMESSAEATDWGSFIITGVLDMKQYSTHLQFDALVSISTAGQIPMIADRLSKWDSHSAAYTYVMLRPDAAPAGLNLALKQIEEKKGDQLGERTFYTQTLSDVRLGEFLGNPISLQLPIEAYYILSILALIVMISAGLNYTNLSVARALTRAKEIGVRKVNGANRSDVFVQFMVESVLIACLSLVLANLLLFLIKPLFLNLWVTRQLHLDLQFNASIFGMFFGFAVVVGLIAGLYPSTVLSRFAPVRIIKGVMPGGNNRMGLRAFLNVAQLVFSLLFIVTAISIVRQFDHYVKHDYGMNTENIVNIPLLGNDYKILMNSMAEVPGVAGVSACHMIPAMPNSYGTVYSKNGTANEDWFKAELMSLHPNLLTNLGLDVIAGMNHNSRTAGTNQLVVNEYAVKIMGFYSPNDAINQKIHLHDTTWHIIGVVEDFKFQSLVMGEGDKSLLVRFDPSLFNYINVRIDSAEPVETIAELEQKWKEIDPVHPMQAHFYDESLARSNQWMGDLAAVIGFIAFLAIVISCLGLLGMTVYSTERRVKEIGVRKVLGAGLGQLILLLGRSFLIMIGVAIIIAAPLSFFVNRLWIDNIPNQVNFGWGTVLLGTALLLLLATVTIFSQVFRVSKTNPVEFLKYE